MSNHKVKTLGFEREEYARWQLMAIEELEHKCSTYPWTQYLSPFHCSYLYKYLEEERYCTSELVRWAFAVYGGVTVKLDWALDVYHKEFNIDYDTLLTQLRRETSLDGDELADYIKTKLDAEYPLWVHTQHAKEINAENKILREPLTEDACQWIRDYCGNEVETVGIVQLWNRHKRLYWKQCGMLPDNAPVD